MQLLKRIFNSLFITLTLLSYKNTYSQIGSDDFSGTNSPFSYLGYGDMIYSGFNPTSQMGKVGASYLNTTTANPLNPASFGYLALTTLDVGVYGTTRNNQNNSEVVKSGTAGFNYLNLAMPVGKKGGFSMGVNQNMNTLYRFKYENTILLIDSLHEYSTVQGKGNLNNIYLGGSYKIIKNLSLGLNFVYNFGNTRSDKKSSIADSTLFYSIDYQIKNSKMLGLGLKLGALYTLKLDSHNAFVFGATYNFAPNLKTTSSGTELVYFINTPAISDTLINYPETKGKTKLASSYNFGLTYVLNNKLQVVSDYYVANWGKNSSYGVKDTSLRNYQRLGLGIEYLPDTKYNKNFLSNTTYRAGFYTGTDYIKPNSNNLNFWGLTTGVSLPIKKNMSKIHLGIDFNSRGNISTNMQRDRTLNFNFGISFSDRWFIKRYYD